MTYTKSQLQNELFGFMACFGQQVAALYGAADRSWAESAGLETSALWMAVSEMYDYGASGIPTADLLPGGRIQGAHAQAEMFLLALDTSPMRFYLESMGAGLPRLAMHAVKLAVARMVLDGGERHTDYGAQEHGILNGDFGCLTIAEVALLANMDERSVRNAANPKLPEHLKTEPSGKRVVVKPEEARRWLAGRKGFVKTKPYTGDFPEEPQAFDMELSAEAVEHIERAARQAGMSFNAYVMKALSKTVQGEKQ